MDIWTDDLVGLRATQVEARGELRVIQLFHHYLSRETLLKILVDVGLLASVMVGADMIRPGDAPVPVAATHGLSLAGGILIINSTSGLYFPARRGSLPRSLARAVLAMILGLMLAYAIFNGLPASAATGVSIQLAAMFAVAVVIAHRVYANHSSGAQEAHFRILIFGSGTAAKMASEALMASGLHAQIVGYFPAPNESECAVAPEMMLTGCASLRECAMRLNVSEIIVALTERRGGSMPLRELLDCKTHGIKVSDISTYFEKVSGQIRIDYLNAGWLVFGDGFRNRIYHVILKQIFDVICAAVLLVVTAPLMLITALLIRLESDGPILYRQERVGRDGKPYRILKFRSMHVDAEKDGVARWAAAHDDRTTRVGRVIRKFRIDELPQLFNILNGEMSLVGPRPERPVFVEQLTREIPYYLIRQSLKPGITGWAQVKYQYGATLEDTVEKLQYDLYYVKNHTLFLDLLIMIQTIGVVLSGKGAR